MGITASLSLSPSPLTHIVVGTTLTSLWHHHHHWQPPPPPPPPPPLPPPPPPPPLPPSPPPTLPPLAIAIKEIADRYSSSTPRVFLGIRGRESVSSTNRSVKIRRFASKPTWRSNLVSSPLTRHSAAGCKEARKDLSRRTGVRTLCVHKATQGLPRPTTCEGNLNATHVKESELDPHLGDTSKNTRFNCDKSCDGELRRIRRGS
ncbi:hypothetical protein EAI_11670 [Harpegnathos saltator]|uniref:Uncharacterized protein n=1 Tax=Harpegnathos saltator TaxID=610380 RepID=E2BQT8_HARSA|nr:hypothetical protein EAI_11670 [Harpegnathos saltator]